MMLYRQIELRFDMKILARNLKENLSSELQQIKIDKKQNGFLCFQKNLKEIR